MSDISISHHEFLSQLSELMVANLENEHFGVSELARAMGMSRSNLHRKVNSLLKISASQYIREFRLEKAKILLKETSLTVSEITYRVGFGSTSYFIKCFREYFGFTPGDSINLKNGEFKSSAKTSNKKRKIIFIATTLFVLLIATVLFVVFIPSSENKTAKASKSIAIMPFDDLSPSAEKSYIINGLREDILDNLISVKDIKVISEVLIDQYLNSDLSAREIAKKTKADYLLTAKGETNENSTTVWFTLTETNTNKQLWRDNRNLSVSNYFELRKEIAYTVANRLKADLTEEDKKVFEKIPTKNLAAYNLFLSGEEYLKLSDVNASFASSEAHALVQKAKMNFEKAVQLDSTFAEAYAHLGYIYISILSHELNVALSEQYIDSGLVMAKKAIFYDNKNAWAYGTVGQYYVHKGDFTKAIEFFDKSEKLSKKNIEDWEKYGVSFWRAYVLRDRYQSIENYYLYKKTKPVQMTQNELQHHIFNLNATGFPEVSQKVAVEILNLDNDSISYYDRLGRSEMLSGEFETGLKNYFKASNISKFKTHYILFVPVECYFYLRDYERVISIDNEIKKHLDASNITYNLAIEHGFIYLVLGQNEKAKSHFKRSMLEIQKEIELNRPNAQIYETHFKLACIYSALNQKEKAIEYLIQLKKRNFIDVWLVNRLKYNPMLDNIRNEPEFAEVLKDVESKYQKEHEKVRELLMKLGEIE